ncbi:hypothetical protein WR25_21565 [Diploscapter pachys]|uniref:ShKT domain-containing protein n=1 Tax=Diploscapter pachys TaxID=2018661 RepID=A0A2A2KQK3_9BILA|nr:hypothetical protein WR25_21565 [Diploscapter pachys]
MKILYLLFYVFVVLEATEPHKRVARRQATGNITNPFVQTRREAMIRRRLAREPPRDCSDAPDENIKTTCLMIRAMDTQTRRRLARQAMRNIIPQAPAGPPNWLQPLPVPGNARGQTAYHPYDCMTITCLCPFFAGRIVGGNCILANGQPLLMSYRKEYRMMTEDERNRWHRALNVLKRNGEYDRMSYQHFEVGVGSGAHSGPGFLPWHREFLKRFEIALRMVDPSVAIPYWDSVMDSYLPDPRDSIFFSDLFVGMPDWYGNVVSGPFAYWRTLDGRAAILRALGREGQLFTEAQVNNIVAQNTIENTMAFTAPQLGCPYPNNYGAIEYTHSNIHLFIGGDMKPPSTSSNDVRRIYEAKVIFWMHHSFVDYLWELWRQLKQPRWYREVAYSADHGYCTNWLHFSYGPMRPFPYLMNRDGLSNSYTDQMYRYAPRATCSFQNPSCGSPYLFCDTRGYPHCVAKIKINGNCMGFEAYDSCYAGRCWYGRCVPGAWARAAKTAELNNETMIPMELFEAALEEPKKAEIPLIKSIKVEFSTPLFNDCFNRHPCCTAWAESGSCNSEPEYMGVYCAASCHVCQPDYNITNPCLDRHVNCRPWKEAGMCSGASADFMSENCRESCEKCELDREDQCTIDGKPVPVPSTEKLKESIRDYSIEKKVKDAVAKAKLVRISKKKQEIRNEMAEAKKIPMHKNSGTTGTENGRHIVQNNLPGRS